MGLPGHPVHLIAEREFARPAPAEPNTEHQQLQWRNIGYFPVNGAIPENGKLMLSSPNSPMACRLQIIWGKSQDTMGSGFRGVQTHPEDSLASLCPFHRKVTRGSSHLRAQELKLRSRTYL